MQAGDGLSTTPLSRRATQFSSFVPRQAVKSVAAMELLGVGHILFPAIKDTTLRDKLSSCYIVLIARTASLLRDKRLGQYISRVSAGFENRLRDCFQSNGFRARVFDIGCINARGRHFLSDLL